MVRPTLPEEERLSSPVYVLLRPRERRLLERIAAKKKMKLGAVLREAFGIVYQDGGRFDHSSL